MAFKWIGKLTGGLLGGLVLGPIGAALGVLLGHQFDEQGERDAAPAVAEDLAAIGERLFRTTFHVMGYLAKSDGRVSEPEIAAARAVMQDLRLNDVQVRQAIACFSEGKQSGFDAEGELTALARSCRGRPDLARIFIEIQVRAALAGNNLEGPVRPLLGRMAATLGVSALEMMHIEAVLRIQRSGFTPGMRGTAAARDRELEAAYRVLETEAGASD
jgi:DnaJ like chaperone protein